MQIRVIDVIVALAVCIAIALSFGAIAALMTGLAKF